MKTLTLAFLVFAVVPARQVFSAEYSGYRGQSFYGIALAEFHGEEKFVEVRVDIEQPGFLLNVAQKDLPAEKVFFDQALQPMSVADLESVLGKDSPIGHLEGFSTGKQVDGQHQCPCLIFKRENPKAEGVQFALTALFGKNLPQFKPGLFSPDQTILFLVSEEEYGAGEVDTMAQTFFGADPSDIVRLNADLPKP